MRLTRGLFVISGLAVAAVVLFAGAPASADDSPATQPASASPATQPQDNLPPFEAELSVQRTGKTLAYTLYQPKPQGDRKAAMVVWLHGQGQSGDEKVLAEYKQPLLEAGIALLIPHTKDPGIWEANDTGRLVDTLKAVAKASGRIDPKRTILMGYSAGGQLAFALARALPQQVAGVVVMSALPMVNTGGRQQLWVPDAKLKDSMRFFLIVGDQEDTRVAMRRVEAVYRARGLSVALKEMPDVGHSYAAGLQDVLAPWMKSVAAGEKPDDPMAEQRQADLAARQKAAVAFLTELKRLGAANAPTTQPATQPADAGGDEEAGEEHPAIAAAEPPADAQVEQVGPFTFHLGPRWSRVQKAAGNQPAVWRLDAKAGKADGTPLANLALSKFDVPTDFSTYLRQRYALEILKGQYTGLHGRGTTRLTGQGAIMVMLSEKRVQRNPGEVKLFETTDYRLELFTEVERGQSYLGLAFQWREGGDLSPEQAAAELFEVLRFMKREARPASQPGEDAPPDGDELPPDLIG